MDESWIGAYDFGFAMSAVAQLGCLVIIARQIVLRLSWRARGRWTALLAFVYVGTLVASSRLAVAAILTTLIMQTLMTVRDGYRVLRVAAVAQQPYFPHIYQVLIKPLGEWIGEPGFKWITVVLVTVLAVFVIWEPRDGVFTPQIMEFISAPTRYVSAWW